MFVGVSEGGAWLKLKMEAQAANREGTILVYVDIPSYHFPYSIRGDSHFIIVQ